MKCDYEYFGPEKIEDWLKWVKVRVVRCLKISKTREMFLYNCRDSGLFITDEETFLRIYWKKNKKEIEEPISNKCYKYVKREKEISVET